jgi:hypothetical protein
MMSERRGKGKGKIGEEGRDRRGVNEFKKKCFSVVCLCFCGRVKPPEKNLRSIFTYF